MKDSIKGRVIIMTQDVGYTTQTPMKIGAIAKVVEADGEWEHYTNVGMKWVGDIVTDKANFTIWSDYWKFATPVEIAKYRCENETY